MFDDKSDAGSEPKLFSERPEWADVVPLEQYENMNPIAPIVYTPEYKDATDYFRAIAKSGEKSPRVLELTEAIIRMNPGHYSAWQYRYDTLLAIKAPLDAEVTLMNELAVKYLKSYQVWHHRRLLLTHTRTPTAELAFITRSLAEDAKNYHTWSYRQWLLAYFSEAEDFKKGERKEEVEEMWIREMDFVEEMLGRDVRNNSAWHHRFFVVFESGRLRGGEERERVVKRELIFTKQSISLAPNNASAWNYLRGILEHSNIPFSTLIEFVKPYTEPANPSTPTTAADVVDLDNPRPGEGADLPCVAAVEFLADAYERRGDKESVFEAVGLWKRLGAELDTVRKK
ncbi:farnesyltransferase/geranylgeranyltransferase type I alpha subunit [Coprinopsis cinerea okayama7|uniref:Protein farnesyltransferase/geranylgeranyltransferase type-1 subunit alpha n=1 Tax=Coprinopsis cinerea (strain Okayama-7 / 130 / ATCC MYA-4618 / FGSC 9003) TaxID=240176 RepID=A8NBB6_COPC7|nr:farnesyltransferase/geranylgeranyltransferase type I alpha subunit [Coprinopsis cinerea okayama7\|eukprot:XP_001832115.2 farnesyltransferase/geranylgeranyltransferase type I alpha subunit [Coprinopsis cinerea okayama7\